MNPDPMRTSKRHGAHLIETRSTDSPIVRVRGRREVHNSPTWEYGDGYTAWKEDEPFFDLKFMGLLYEGGRAGGIEGWVVSDEAGWFCLG